jgi:hypothetical protein
LPNRADYGVSCQLAHDPILDKGVPGFQPLYLAWRVMPGLDYRDLAVGAGHGTIVAIVIMIRI